MGIGKTKRERRNDLRSMARRIAAVLFVGMMIVASLHLYNYLTTSERFAITHVEFEGLSRVDDEGISALLRDLHGQNLFLAPLKSYEARVAAHSRVAEVTLRRVPPDRVTCTVREREPVALVFTDHFLEVDATGVVMEEDEFTALLDLPIITGISADDVRPGRRSDSPQLRGALDALTACKVLGGSFAADISELRVSDGGITIQSLSRNCVLVLGNGDYERKLRKYFVLRDEIAPRERTAWLIDLRFEDQVVLRGRI